MEKGTFTDPRDGKTYKTIKIGEQVWMAENLAYNAEGSKCYDNNEENGKKYGRLYDWDTANKACPKGWKVPTSAEWQTLEDFVGGDNIAGKKLKAQRGWNKDGNGTDDFGFAALPGGECYTDGSFVEGGDCGYWWSSTYNSNDDRGYGWLLLNCDSKLGDTNLNKDSTYKLLIPKPSLLSVRCIQLSAIENLIEKYEGLFQENAAPSIKAASPSVAKPENTTEKVMFCSNCGNKLESNVSFCPKCGTKVGSSPSNTSTTSSTFTDPRDGRVYKTVKIGGQVWLAENLAFEAPGKNCKSPDNDPDNFEKYGLLYDWETAMKACPPGWHLPSNEEWQKLVDLAGGKDIAGKKLKAKSGWFHHDGKPSNGTDDFGFSALPGGYGHRTVDFSIVEFGNIECTGTWWSATEYSASKAYHLTIHNRGTSTNKDTADKSQFKLYSVRCIKD